MKRRVSLWLCVLSIVGGAIIAAGCGEKEEEASTAAATLPNSDAAAATSGQKEKDPAYEAKAILRAVGDSGASGTATYKKNSFGTYDFKLDVRGLRRAIGEHQYAIFQFDSPKNLKTLQNPEEMGWFGSYRLRHAGRLSIETEVSPRGAESLKRGELTYFFLTTVKSDDRLRDSIVEFDETGKIPAYGTPIVAGRFKGPLVNSEDTE